MSRIILISIIIFSFIINPSYAQKATKRDSVIIMKVVNPDVYHILDSIIDHERNCDYYTNDMIFDIWITPDYIQFSTIGKQKHLLNIEYGLFFYKNHIFFVSMKKDETLFLPTAYKILYEFDVSTNYVDSDGIVHLYNYENDSLSYWIYKYESGKFTLDGISTYCE